MGYRRNDIVMIYEDFLTKQKPEGKAKLIKQIKFREQDCTELWEVKFVHDELGEPSVLRWLSSPQEIKTK